MEEFSGYILSVVAAAIIVGIPGDLISKNGSMGKIYRLIGGLFLSFTIISPMVNLDFSNINDFFEDFALEAEYHAAAGESEADKSYRAIIKSRAEAYILDKAELYQASIRADVTLSDEESAVPVSVQLIGNVSPYAKIQLSEIIEAELGIAKENQKWIG